MRKSESCRLSAAVTTWYAAIVVAPFRKRKIQPDPNVRIVRTGAATFFNLQLLLGHRLIFHDGDTTEVQSKLLYLELCRLSLGLELIRIRRKINRCHAFRISRVLYAHAEVFSELLRRRAQKHPSLYCFSRHYVAVLRNRTESSIRRAYSITR